LATSSFYLFSERNKQYVDLRRIHLLQVVKCRPLIIAVSLSSGSTSALVVTYAGVSDYLVCSEHWTSALSHAVCRQLGYPWAIELTLNSALHNYADILRDLCTVKQVRFFSADYLIINSVDQFWRDATNDPVVPDQFRSVCAAPFLMKSKLVSRLFWSLLVNDW